MAPDGRDCYQPLGEEFIAHVSESGTSQCISVVLHLRDWGAASELCSREKEAGMNKHVFFNAI